jgi:Vitamin B12 dependent methionine synthase, activation domain
MTPPVPIDPPAGGATPRVLDPLPIEVPRPMVLLRLGYRRPSQVPERTSRLIAEVMQQGSRLLRPRAIIAEVEVDLRDDGAVELIGAFRAASGSLRRRLEGCRRATLFAATIGSPLEEWAQQAMQAGEMTRALLIDAYGSAAATALGLELERVVGRTFGTEGLQPTKRYAPGYGDWDIADQTPLLGYLGATRIGISVTEDHLMLPAKSISGLIGAAGGEKP